MIVQLKYKIEEKIPIKQVNNFFKKLIIKLIMNYLNVIQYLKILKKIFIKILGFWFWLFTLLSIIIRIFNLFILSKKKFI